MFGSFNTARRVTSAREAQRTATIGIDTFKDASNRKQAEWSPQDSVMGVQTEVYRDANGIRGGYFQDSDGVWVAQADDSGGGNWESAEFGSPWEAKAWVEEFAARHGRTSSRKQANWEELGTNYWVRDYEDLGLSTEVAENNGSWDWFVSDGESGHIVEEGSASSAEDAKSAADQFVANGM